MAIVRFNPVKDFLNVEREINRMFKSIDDRFGFLKKENSDDEYENAVWIPLSDVYEDKDDYKITADLPGIKKEDVKISVSNGKLSISGERKQKEETKEAKYHRIERTFGKYYRSFTLPKEIKEDKIKAAFKDGQITVTIPKTEDVKPKEIAIKVN